jgi:exodeoxyribonuclease VII small subunit
MTTAKSNTQNLPLNDSLASMPLNFEQAYAELEQIIAQMEAAPLPLDASLAAYQRGNSLLQFCQQSLLAAEQQVQILNERNQLLAYKSQDPS